MLSSLEALSAAGAATVARPAAFQPKVKPRLRRPGKPSDAEENAASAEATSPSAILSAQVPRSGPTVAPASQAPVSSRTPVASHSSENQDAQVRLPPLSQNQASSSRIPPASQLPQNGASASGIQPSPAPEILRRPGKEPIQSPTLFSGNNVESIPSCSQTLPVATPDEAKKRINSSAPRKRRSFLDDLQDPDPSRMTLSDIIRFAEAKERKKLKVEAAAKKQEDQNSPLPQVREEVRERDSGIALAPQVEIVNGDIVINRQSLQVDAGSISREDYSSYRRIEETHSKLNYHTYMKKAPRDRWKSDETEMFYKAVQQFGTDFEVIQHLFPTKTRRQIKAKYKKEERENPRRLTDIILKPRSDLAQYEELVNILKASAAEKAAAEDEYEFTWNVNTASTGQASVAAAAATSTMEDAYAEENEDFQPDGVEKLEEEEEQFKEELGLSEQPALAEKEEAAPSLFAFQSFKDDDELF